MRGFSVLSDFRVTRHARTRMQGRSTGANTVDVVLRYGTEERAAVGRPLVRLDHEFRAELSRKHPHLRGRLGIYIVLADGAIVTVCHDDGRLRRRLH